MKQSISWLYPFLIGLLFGFIQTGYFIRLSFALASTYGTFLMVTLAWLAGSIAGLRLNSVRRLTLSGGMWLCIVPYLVALLFVYTHPFQGQWWPIYTLLIFMSGSFSGLFFARTGEVISPVRHLFFVENNGFLLGLTLLPVLYLLFGQIMLWILPTLTTIVCLIWTPHLTTAPAESIFSDPVHEGIPS
jgi:hypothetical protein